MITKKNFYLSTAFFLRVSLAVCFINISSSCFACMSDGTVNIRIVRSANDEHATAFVSLYDCSMMVAKTYCAVGVGLNENAATKNAAIQVTYMQFVNAATGKDISGFGVTPKLNTTLGFREEQKGIWYGFWGLFSKPMVTRDVVELKFEFQMAPGTSDEDLVKAFDGASIGAAQGGSDGKVMRGDHFEIAKVESVKVLSLNKMPQMKDGKK